MGSSMTAHRLDLMLPVPLQPSDSVKVWLFRSPTPELHAALSDLGFHIAGYSDERSGKVASLDAVLETAEGHGNPVHKMQTLLDLTSQDTVGSIAAHARVYEPSATTANLLRGVHVPRGTRLQRLGDRWVAWGSGILTT